MNRLRLIILIIIIETLLILSIAAANHFGTPLFYIFYTGIYGFILSTMVPLVITAASKESFESLGFKKPGTRQIIVIVLFVAFSISGQLVPLHISSTTVHYELLKVCILPLILTTFFEEFLFRGFMQTRIDQLFGAVPAVIISGLVFSVYHLGYPGFRTINDLLILWAVGIGFALSFKLSGNNVIVSYLVNLPNAFVTYILKSEQFPQYAFTGTYSLIALIGSCFIIFILLFSHSRLKNRKKPNTEYNKFTTK